VNLKTGTDIEPRIEELEIIKDRFEIFRLYGSPRRFQFKIQRNLR